MSVPKPFSERYEAALANDALSESLLSFQRSWRDTRDAQILDLESISGLKAEALSSGLAAMKDGVIADLPATIARFRAAAEAAGAIVFEATTAEQANEYIAQLCRDRGVRTVVKGKSMVTEELFLNEHLERAGIKAIETDLGEWLLQLDDDRPSHVVMPAIHRRRQEVARILERELGVPFDDDDIPAMVRSARTALREHFLSAGVGITGANALIASTGSTLLVTNEGNGELSASLPPVHVVVAGIEKLVPTMADAMKQVRLLARSATAQSITTYTSFFTGPTPGHEMHIVLVDNGRRAMAAEDWSSAALRCVKCGACANVCPAYQVVGGHAFGHVYTGPIGLVNTAFHHGIEAAAGPQSLCLSCGACETVCPVEIPLPQQILQVRRRVAEEVGIPRKRRLAMRAFASRRLFGLGVRLAAIAALPFRRGRFTKAPFTARFTTWRSAPALPLRPARAHGALHASRAAIARTEATGRRVTLFMQCVSDRVAPEVVLATADLLRAAGCEVDIPEAQHCCGLPAIDSGDDANARRMARQTLEVLAGADDVVTPAPSCAIAMLHDYERLFEDEPVWQERARRLSGRVYDLTGYLVGPARLPDGVLARGDTRPVAIDRFCQGANVLGRGDTLETLVRGLTGANVVPLDEAEVCCGFGGSTSLLAPDLSRGVLERKLDNVRASGARVLLTDNPGCLLHLGGGADAADMDVTVMHVAEYLAARLPGR
ncbi:MAG: LUD domain-containing protein [Chloroflexi bacterium]|nr:LUD domain-containing protein [Chloroflexota bacterium]MDA1146993.1 LUD domain-containing protein [Chloroflexota bacterium]